MAMQSSAADVASLNEALIAKLKHMGAIETAPVEAAFRAVLRHLFVPGIPLDRVYRDEVIVTKELEGHPASSCEQPGIVAVMLEQLGLEPGQRVLEIGAGTGHMAALMAQIVGPAGRVTTVDIEPDLVASAREHLSAAGLEPVEVVQADGWAGYAPAAPYDRVLLSVAAWDIAPAWPAQLAPGGRVVLPLDLKHARQKAVAFKQAPGHLESISVRECGFMPLRGEAAPWPHEGGGALGPEPGLAVGFEGERAIDRAAVYEWLTGPSRALPTDLDVTRGEIWAGLSLWLALHAAEYCALSAEGAMVDRGLVPPVLCLSYDQNRSCTTFALLGAGGLAALDMTPEPVPPEDTGERAFELLVRSYGPDDGLARRLIEQVRAWDAAGRPAGAGLRIRAYPRGAAYVPAPGEMVLDKRWTQLVLDWPGQRV